MNATATATAPASTVATRNNWKGHGRPERVTYHGSKDQPTAQGTAATITKTGLMLTVQDADGKQIDRLGVAGKMWIAPAAEVTRDEAEELALQADDPEALLSSITVKATPVKAARPGRNAKLHPCLCGCGQQVKGLYKQGHDARHAGDVARKAIAAGADADITAILAELPTEALRVKAAKMIAARVR